MRMRRQFNVWRVWRVVLLFGMLGGLAGVTLSAQSLSQQVLTLLSRTNSWSGVNTFLSTVGVKLESGAVQPTGGCTDRLYNLGGVLQFNCSAIVPVGGGGGTVTSVALTAPGAVFSVAGSPIAGAGTLALTFQTQAANAVWAGATSGGAATPTFRALVDADVPNTITIAGTNNVTWASVDKTGSSLADLATRSAADLGSGKLALARLTTGATVGQALLAGVTDPAYGALDLSGTAVTGILAAARFPALTGDITTASGAVATSLATTTVTAAAYGDSTHYPTFTVDTKGRLTAAAQLTFPAHNILSATHGDSAVAAVARGALIIGNATPAWGRLTVGTAGQFLRTDGTDIAWGVDGSALTTLNGTNISSGTVAIARGGTNGAVVPTLGAVAYGTGTAYAFTAAGAVGQCLTSNGAASPIWGACAVLAGHALLSATHTDTLAAAVTRGALVVGNTTPAWANLAVGTSGQVLKTDGTDTFWSTDGSGLTALNASSLTSGTVPLSRLSNIADTQIAAGAAITWTKIASLAAADALRWVAASVAGTQINAAAAVAGQAQGIIIQRGDGTPQVFANLGAATNGSVIYCSDCANASNPCTGASTGAIAKRLNGSWDCR